jgi:formate dehydrogenase iron-sulfur subunit
MDGEARAGTAVERFSSEHARLPATQRAYRSLVPLAAPGAGEQYAFHVDLDACSGCKSCVAACHSQNGLDDGEVWRSVGLLVSASQPFQQHVTTACHHCVDPACMNGCPTLAYDKDPLTGIVRHLDDQCIGCQYCVLQCPYDVPKFNARLGIVRKCDMCHSRLAVGEAPACAEACPTQAIAIEVVAVAALQQAAFLPGAPDPRLTQPTTRFTSRAPLPADVHAADADTLRPEHPHLPLVVMLVLTQLSAGAFAVGRLLETRGPLHSLHALASLGFGLLALAASTLHLGRPAYAWRAVIGLRTSWLSREILGFSAFAGLATAYAAGALLAPTSPYAGLLGAAVVFCGTASVFCSAMIYHATRRPFWHIARTATRFALTAIVLGLALTLLIGMLVAACDPPESLVRYLATSGGSLARGLVLFGALKLVLELADLRHLRDTTDTPMRHSARLYVGPLHRVAVARFLAGAVGMLALPWLCVRHAPDAAAVLATAVAAFALTLAGELLERHLFFAAVRAPRMPGGPAA